VDYDGKETHTMAPDTLARDAAIAVQSLPPQFLAYPTLAVATASAGKRPGIRLRLWQIWDTPITSAALRDIFRAQTTPNPAIDMGFFTKWRINYINTPEGLTPFPTLDDRMVVIPPTPAPTHLRMPELEEPEVPVGDRDNAMYAYLRHAVEANPRVTLDVLTATATAYAVDTFAEALPDQPTLIRKKAERALRAVVTATATDLPLGVVGPKHRRAENACKRLLADLLPDLSNLPYVYAALHTEFTKGHMPAAEMATLLCADHPGIDHATATREILTEYKVVRPKPAYYQAMETLQDGSIPLTDHNLRELLRCPLFAFEHDAQEGRTYVRKSPDVGCIPLGEWTAQHGFGLSSWAGNPANLLRWRSISDKGALAALIQQVATPVVRLHAELDQCALQWDGVPRIGTLAADALGDDSDIAQTYLRTWLVQAVRRAYDPGTAAELVLVLTGGSGLGKTTFFQNLALREEWYVKALGARPITQADRVIFKSAWIVVLDEFSDSARAHGVLKSILSDRTYTYRPLYQQETVTRPLWYTVGATADTSLYLADVSGSRRFATIHVTKRVVYPDPAQIWGEAVHMYRQGAASQLDLETLSPTLAEAHAQRISGALAGQDLWEYVSNIVDRPYSPAGGPNPRNRELAPAHMFTAAAIASGEGIPEWVSFTWLLDQLGDRVRLFRNPNVDLALLLKNAHFTPVAHRGRNVWRRPQNH
jgi:hypothetical protein